DVSSTVGIQGTEDRDLKFRIDFLQGVGGNSLVKGLENGFALGGSEGFDDVRNIGGMQLGQALQRDLQLYAAGGIDLDQVNKFPRNHPRWNLGQQQIQWSRRHDSLQQAAHCAARSNIHTAQFEHHVVMAEFVVDVHVVHPHHLAPMHVDDLLVQQVSRQQEHAFAASVGYPIGNGG